jgi:hypothetical protein
MTKEETILHHMKVLKISRQEAEQLYEDDENDYIGEEGEEMTRKAKEIRRYEKGEQKRKKTTKERKVDEPKKYLLETIQKSLPAAVEVVGQKTETELNFIYNGENYTIKLTKHRKK